MQQRRLLRGRKVRTKEGALAVTQRREKRRRLFKISWLVDACGTGGSGMPERIGARKLIQLLLSCFKNKACLSSAPGKVQGGNWCHVTGAEFYLYAGLPPPPVFSCSFMRPRKIGRLPRGASLAHTTGNSLHLLPMEPKKPVSVVADGASFSARNNN